MFQDELGNIFRTVHFLACCVDCVAFMLTASVYTFFTIKNPLLCSCRAKVEPCLTPGVRDCAVVKCISAACFTKVLLLAKRKDCILKGCVRKVSAACLAALHWFTRV